MFVSKFRATAAVLLIAGTAAWTAGPAFAAGVRPEVGNPLKEAQQDAAGGRCDAAKSKINQAEGVGAKTSAENSIISQMRQYVGVECGDANSALGAKAKFAKDYNSGRYRDAIADEDILRKFGALDAENMLIIAQAYYKVGDYGGCVRYIKSHMGGGGQNALELERRCAFENGDADTQRDALEQLVSSTGKPEYWSELLDAASKTHGLNDHETLDIYRIKLLTGAIKTADDVKLISELAIENGDNAEAVNIIQKSAGVPGVAGNDRFNRLLATAKAQAAADAANLAKATAAAATGDALVKLGEAQWAVKPADTVRLVQMGIQKGVNDKGNAQLRLGMGYLGSGQKDSALRAFSAAKNDPKWQVVARLWMLYARR